jgi:hypothetical protein
MQHRSHRPSRHPFHFEALEGRDLLAALHEGVRVNDLANASIFDAQTTTNVAASPNGNIYVAYGGSNGVRVATSSNRGESFAKSVKLSAGTANSVAVAVSGDEDVFVAWNVGNKLWVARSTNDGVSFGAANLVSSSFGGGIAIAVEGNNVYLGDQSGYTVFANTHDAIGTFTSAGTGGAAFGHLAADPTTGDLYQLTDDPNVVVSVSDNHAVSFTGIGLSGGANIYYSNVAASFGDQGKFGFIAGGAYDNDVDDDAFRIDLDTGALTPLVFGENTNFQGRDLDADSLGDVVDSFYSNGEIHYRVSQDLGDTFGTEINVATATSSNVAINFAYQDIVVVYQVGGNLFVSTFANELLTQFDFGDAPNTYGTTLSSNGARHNTGDLFLGTGVDIDADGHPSVGADGDNLDADDDEDGVTLPGLIIAGQAATITVNASTAGKLDAWFDLNRNGKFEATEKVLNSVNVIAGDNELSLTLPSSAISGDSFARFRISSAGGLSASGFAPDGEVEDYAVSVFGGGDARILEDSIAQENVLTVNGTGNSDAIAVQLVPGSTTHVQVVAFGKVLGPFALADFDRIEVRGAEGNDSISIAASITKPTLIHGGAGNDSIVGGGGDDVIFGEAGVDSISGGAGTDIILGGEGADSLLGGIGRDLLIGGNGVDSLNGQDGDDILIGGRTEHDDDLATLQRIAGIWAANNTFDARRTALAGDLNAMTVLNDGVRDNVTGGGGRDWMLDYALLDLFLDYSANATTGDRKN